MIISARQTSLTHKGITIVHILEWLLVPFVIGLMTLSHLATFSRLMGLYGIVLTWMFLIYFLNRRLKLQPEIIIYFVWIVWSLWGALYAVKPELFAQQLMTIIQMGILMFLIAGIIAERINLNKLMIAIALGGVLVLISSLTTEELSHAASMDAHVRAVGLTNNANSFAYHLVFVVIAACYFWQDKLSLLRRSLLIATIGMAILGTIYSGSRKAFLGLMVFFVLLFLFSHAKKIFRKPVVNLAVAFLLLGSLYVAIDFTLSKTYLGERFQYQKVSEGSSTRMEMYNAGLKMIRSHPLVGVGLDNYRVISGFYTYSHSDFIEVAANTGLIGFMLYFSIYYLLWRRLQRIKSRTRDPRTQHIISLLKSSLITILLIALGRPNITSKLTWLFLAGAIGYSWALERRLDSERSESVI